MTIDQLTAAGQLLYGDQWQANLARSLNVDVRRIRHWTDGTRPLPDWIAGEVYLLLDNNQSNINLFLTTLQKDVAMISFIDKLDSNIKVTAKVAQHPKSPRSIEAVQASLASIVIAVYKNNLFKIAGLDKDHRKLISFTASKGDADIELYFGEDWRDKVIKIERIGNPNEFIKLEDIA